MYLLLNIYVCVRVYKIQTYINIYKIPLPPFLPVFFETVFICFKSFSGSLKALLDSLNPASDGISDLL